MILQPAFQPYSPQHMWTTLWNSSFIKINLIFHDILNSCLSKQELHFIVGIRCPLLGAIRDLENEAQTGVRE